MGKGGKPKKPGAAFNPDDRKVPRGGGLADRVPTLKFAWRSDRIIFDGRWGWGDVTIRTAMSEIVPKLHDYETMTWSQVDGPSGSHFVERDKLCPDAQALLDDLGLRDVEELFSLRITGRRRLWGIRDHATFRVLWWDPEHEVCPSVKKHT